MIFQRVETQVNEHNKQSHCIVFIVSPRQYIAVYNMLPWSKARAMLFYVDMFIHWKCKVNKTSSVKLLFPSRLRKSSIWCQNGIKILTVMFSNRVPILLHKNPPSGTNRYYAYVVSGESINFCSLTSIFFVDNPCIFIFFSFTCFFFIHPPGCFGGGGNWNTKWGKKIILLKM